MLPAVQKRVPSRLRGPLAKSVVGFIKWRVIQCTLLVVASRITWFRLRSIADLSCCPAFFSYSILLVLLLECCLLPFCFVCLPFSNFKVYKPREKRRLLPEHSEQSRQSNRRWWQSTTVDKKPSRRPGMAITYDVKQPPCASTGILSWL